MDVELFNLFEKEILDEAKRIVPLVYDEKKFCMFDIDNYKKYINKRYFNFVIEIQLLLVGLCSRKYDGDDWENYAYDLEKDVEHHIKVLEYDKKQYGANIAETIDNVAKEIICNYNKYKYKSLYEIMPLLVNKYMNTHNDSVEHTAFVLYLNSSFKKYGKYLSSTDLIDLQDI